MERQEGRPLTVRELIEQLSRLDPELPVACRYDGSQETGAGPVTVERISTFDWESNSEASMTFAVIGDEYLLDRWMRNRMFPAAPEARPEKD